MAGRRATRPVDEGTFEGRLRRARLDSSYDAQQLAEAIGKASAQSIYDYETVGKSDSPSPAALGIISRLTGRSLKWLIYGSDDDAAQDSPFIQQMRAFDADPLFDDRGRHVTRRTAEAEIEEARRRLAEAPPVDLRDLDEAERRSVLGVPSDLQAMVADSMRRLHAIDREVETGDLEERQLRQGSGRVRVRG